MSLDKILNKLTLEEIKELTDSLSSQQENFFGNKLKDSKNRSLVAKTFGIKNWNTLVGLKDNKSKPKSYKCPECGSDDFYCKIDAYDYCGIDSKGKVTESREVAHYDDFEYCCLACDYACEIIFITYELVLKGYKDDGTKDDLVVWVNIEDKYDYSFEELLKKNENIQEFNKIDFISNDDKGLDLTLHYFPNHSISKLNNIINKKLGV